MGSLASRMPCFSILLALDKKYGGFMVTATCVSFCCYYLGGFLMFALCFLIASVLCLGCLWSSQLLLVWYPFFLLGPRARTQHANL